MIASSPGAARVLHEEGVDAAPAYVELSGSPQSRGSGSSMYDVIVIGGGIHGLANAVTLSERGLSVVLLERLRIGGETSSQSHRIIHGGLRYLQRLSIGRALRSLDAQKDFSTRFPDLTERVPCVVSMSDLGSLPARLAPFGLSGYRMLSRLRNGQDVPAGILKGPELDSRFAGLDGLIRLPAMMWHDLWMSDPSKIHAELCHQIRASGRGVVVENCEVSSCEREGKAWRVETAREVYKGRWIIDARGPWVRRQLGAEKRAPKARWIRAFNLVVRKKISFHGVVGFRGRDKRLLFVSPRREDSVAIGTWYSTPIETVSEGGIGPRDVDAGVQELREVAPALDIHLQDVLRIEEGMIPEGVRVPHDSFQISRRAVTLLSTKYTTAFTTAQEISRKIR